MGELVLLALAPGSSSSSIAQAWKSVSISSHGLLEMAQPRLLDVAPGKRAAAGLLVHFPRFRARARTAVAIARRLRACRPLFFEPLDHRQMGFGNAWIDRQRGMGSGEAVVDTRGRSRSADWTGQWRAAPRPAHNKGRSRPPGCRSASPVPRGGRRRGCRSPNIGAPADRGCRLRHWSCRAVRSPSFLRAAA